MAETGPDVSPRSAPTPLAVAAPAPDERVTGILLAGGRSARMSTDKAWAELAGRPLIRWVLDALQAVTQEQLVVAREPGRLPELGVPVALDRGDARGPIAGIHAGLRAARAPVCLVVACDLPLVRPRLLALLARELGAANAAVPYIPEAALPTSSAGAAFGDAGPQPLLAAYHRRCAALIEPLLAHGPIPTAALMGVLRARVIPQATWRQADPDGRSFVNVNTSEDLAEASRRLVAGG